MEYILFVFATHKNQGAFVKVLAEDIVSVVGKSDIKYYYGPESSIFVFKTFDEEKKIQEYFSTVLGESGIVYFLVRHEPDKMSYWLDPNIEKHLFNTDNSSKDSSNTLEEQLEAQKLFFGDLEEETDMVLTESDEDDLLKLRKNKKTEPTFDELFNKIADQGYESLSSFEKELLKKYTK